LRDDLQPDIRPEAKPSSLRKLFGRLGEKGPDRE